MAQDPSQHFHPQPCPVNSSGVVFCAAAHFYVSRLSFRAIAFYPNQPLPHVPERRISFLLLSQFLLLSYLFSSPVLSFITLLNRDMIITIKHCNTENLDQNHTSWFIMFFVFVPFVFCPSSNLFRFRFQIAFCLPFLLSFNPHTSESPKLYLMSKLLELFYYFSADTDWICGSFRISSLCNMVSLPGKY